MIHWGAAGGDRRQSTWWLGKLESIHTESEEAPPQRALAMVQRFMEKEGHVGDKHRPSHWFDVPEGTPWSAW